MNKEKIKILEETVASMPHYKDGSVFTKSDMEKDHFSMNYIGTKNNNFVLQELPQSDEHCGTTMCLAGLAVGLFRPEEYTFNQKRHMTAHAAKKILGLNHREAHKLFFMESSRHQYKDVKPEDAAAVLRHFRETGEVNWDMVLDQKEK